MSLVQWSSVLALALLCGAAVVSDIRERRIPNALVLAGMALGLSVQALAPRGDGLFSTDAGALGLSAALLGALAGLAILMPLHLLRAMGAGDVKLLAMVGVWLGATHVAWAALWSFVCGGVLALAVALHGGVLRQVLSNLRFMCTATLIRLQAGAGTSIENPHIPTGRLPYAVAIASGAAIEVARLLLGSTSP